MRFPRVVVAMSVTALLLSSLAVVAAAQVQNYQKGQSYFPNPLAPYSPRKVAPPNLSNSPRIDTLLRNGRERQIGNENRNRNRESNHAPP